MRDELDTVIRISSGRAEITVEQTDEAGVTARKALSAETFAKCILGSRFNEAVFHTGLLPENCIAATVSEDKTVYYLRHPRLYADVNYYGTEYPAFPLPRMVFGFGYDTQSGKIVSQKLCVVKDSQLTMETPTYHYPFSNVYSNYNICIGSNELPTYKNPMKLGNLADYILQMPNNNDMFSETHNRLHLGYRDLLEHLKDKPPAYYYTDVLIPDGKRLKDFLNGR